jgi:predicted TIM-barrel fold metal-dependent hydrolase
MKMIDAQMHLWLPNTPDRPWDKTAKHNHGVSFTAEQAIALMDKTGVSGTVIVPPSWTGADNSYAVESAAKYPSRFVAMGRYDHDAPDARDQLDTWRDAPGMVGMRVTLHNEAAERLFKGRDFYWFWERCEAIDMPLMCYVPRNIPVLAEIAQRHPRLRLIADHCARFAQGPKDEAAWVDIAELLKMAKLPNVAVKVSSLPSFSTQPFPFPNLHPHIRAIYDGFGASRMIWGSDVTRLTCTYEENIELFSRALDFLSEDEKEWIFSRTLAKWCDVKL